MSNNDITRSDIISWINDTLALSITKIEQLGSGAIYCQIFDSIYGDVPIGKVKFDTVLEYEFISNFKILQGVFNKHRIQKPIPIEKLIKCKFQDNYEFICWAKRFWDAHPPMADYDPIARRRAAAKTILPNSRSRSNSRISSPKNSNSPLYGSSQNLSASASAPSHHIQAAKPTGNRPRSSTQPVRSSISNQSMRSSEAGSAFKPVLKSSMSYYDSNNSDLRQELTNLSRERNFYYKKLRDIENIVQATLDDPLSFGSQTIAMASRIKDILYALEEGFEIPKSGSPAIPPELETSIVTSLADDTF